MQSISACKLFKYVIPCYQFIWNNLLWLHTSALIRRSNTTQMNPSGEKKRLTVKHACACANLLRLLFRHIYLIRLNQHRVVMIKHFSPISVWERDTQAEPPCSKGGKARVPLSFSVSLPQTASVSLALSSFPQCASFSHSFSLPF